MIRLGMIGCGSRGSGLARIFTKLPFEATIAAVADLDPDNAKKRLADREVETGSTRFYDDVDRMLDGEKLDAVIVATRCSLHTPMAVKVLARKLPIYLEKPVATSIEQWRQLSAAAAASADVPAVVSFPLRVTQVALTARRIIQSGQLGQITHVQAINNVPYGEVYFQTWYRDENETGGLFLQKATHDVDAINALLGDVEPQLVAAMSSKLVFRGDKPAGQKCLDCDEKLTCLESKLNPSASTGAALQATADRYHCAFAVDTGNEDSGNLIVQYANGVQANYSQNFYSRRGAATRMVRCIGHLGTVQFDWTDEVAHVWMHHNGRVETHDCKTKGQSHGGGDQALAINFLQCVLGQAESISPLANGLRSALICLLARESARTRQFQDAAALLGC